MIIINDKDGDNRHEMRTYMRSRMRVGNYRGSYGYRTSTSYKDEESWKEGYEKGYKDACEDMKSGEL